MDSPVFTIKICGVTRPADAAAVCASGADAIGLNFYRPSIRFLADDVTPQIVAEIADHVEKVGVFVNETIDEILRRTSDCELAWIQLHGDEPAHTLRELQSAAKIIKAFRYGAAGLTPVLEYLDQCDQLNARCDAILLDAAKAGHFGGSGETFDWQQLRDELTRLPPNLPWILAGGLNPENVAFAANQLKPHGVDTASGVESKSGFKDANRILEFVKGARSGLQA